MKSIDSDQGKVILLLRFRSENPNKTSKVFLTYRKIAKLTGFSENQINSFVRKTIKICIGKAIKKKL